MRRRLVEKMLAVAMVVAMVVPLAACGNDAKGSGSGSQQDEEQGSDESGTEDEDDRPFGKYIKDEVAEDLGGYEFLIIDCDSDQWYPENGEIQSAEDELKLNIIQDVEEKFNCRITVQSEGGGEIFNNAQPAIMGGEKYADVIGIKQWGFGPLFAANLLLDLSTVDSIDLTADYWNQNVVDFMTFGNATYGIGGSFAPDFGSAGVIFYNQRIWDELTLEDGSKLPSPRELLDNNEWTWDKLLELARLACRDLDGDGKVSSAADRYGLVGPISSIFERLIGGVGEDFIAKNADGTLKLGLTSDTVTEKLNWYSDFFNKNSVVHIESEFQYEEKFTEGGALFMCTGNIDSKALREMEDDWGVLPPPKWDADQKEYYCALDANAPLFCMTRTNKNTHEAGVILSALARRFQAVEEMAFNNRIDTLWRLDETGYIVDTYVRGHAKYEVLHLVKSINNVFNYPSSALDTAARGGLNDIPSEMKAYEDQINIALDELFSDRAK